MEYLPGLLASSNRVLASGTTSSPEIPYLKRVLLEEGKPVTTVLIGVPLPMWQIYREVIDPKKKKKSTKQTKRMNSITHTYE